LKIILASDGAGSLEQGMARVLSAPLSPREEVTLRRVALGITSLNDLPTAHLMRLEQLGLIKLDGDRANLTRVGEAHYQSLPRAAVSNSEGRSSQLVRVLVRHIQQHRPARG
jgi:hypothetical protein